MNRIAVMLAGDHTIVREGFRTMLGLDAGLAVVGEAQDGRQAAELVISIKTVEKNRAHLINRLAIYDTAGPTRYAIATGIIENRVLPTTNLRDFPEVSPRLQRMC